MCKNNNTILSHQEKGLPNEWNSSWYSNIHISFLPEVFDEVDLRWELKNAWYINMKGISYQKERKDKGKLLAASKFGDHEKNLLVGYSGQVEVMMKLFYMTKVSKQESMGKFCPVFVNKILLDSSHTICLVTVSTCIPATMVGFHSCDRALWLAKF